MELLKLEGAECTICENEKGFWKHLNSPCPVSMI